MKAFHKVALAALAIILTVAPASAYANGHTPTYRDHTPRVHVRHPHPRG